MRGKKELLRTIKDNSLLISDWEKKVWMMTVYGFMDYTQKGMISGFCDAHTHICRCFTYAEEFLPPGININEIADLPLKVKQDLIGFLHDGPAYSVRSLQERMTRQIKRTIEIGTREMWAIVDTTPDIGLRAFEVALKLKEEFARQIEIKVGCYPVFGLKNPLENPDRLKIIKLAAKRADFIVGLPEKDDEEGKIGFKRHVSLLLDMSFERKIEVQIHVDQENSALQNDSFQVIECLEGLVPKKFSWFTAPGRPKLWLVHMISPSCYEPQKFTKLVNLLVKYNIGVIVCPDAAISMRNLRSENGPLHNSIARVIELLKAGVKIRFGTDNVGDIFVPSGSGLILREIGNLSNHVRNYLSHILAKVGVGMDLNNGDRAILAQALREADKAHSRHARELRGVENNSDIHFKF